MPPQHPQLADAGSLFLAPFLMLFSGLFVTRKLFKCHAANRHFENRRIPLHPEIEEVARGSFRRREPPEIRGSGYVVKSLEASLWAFQGAADFWQAVLRAVNLGDDADTTGAACGRCGFVGQSYLGGERI